MKKYLLLLLLALSLGTHEIIASAPSSSSRALEKLTYCAIPENLKAHFLPQRHALKPVLDGIFTHPGILKNDETFSAAGFEILLIKKAGHTKSAHWRLARHPLLPGYLFKVYLDNATEMGKNECLKKLGDRCLGAENIRKLIKSKKLRHFVVPDKWLYRVPLDPLSKEMQQPVILMVTDMRLVSRAQCKEAWLNVTKEQLDELFCIFNHRYASTFLYGNIPYTKDGKFACIDTELPVRKKVEWDRVKHFISDEMGPYWDSLMRKRH